MAKQVKRKSSGITKPDGNRKRGRSEMRTVTRTAARKPRDEEQDDDSSDHLEEEAVHQSNGDDYEDTDGENDEDEDSGKLILLF